MVSCRFASFVFRCFLLMIVIVSQPNKNAAKSKYQLELNSKANAMPTSYDASLKNVAMKRFASYDLTDFAVGLFVAVFFTYLPLKQEICETDSHLLEVGADLLNSHCPIL